MDQGHTTAGSGFGGVPLPPSFDSECSMIRKDIKRTAEHILSLKDHPAFSEVGDDVKDGQEMIANLMLAYRHLEDGSMRLGKAIQAFDGGKSVYDK